MEIQNANPEEELAHMVGALIDAYEGQNQKVVNLIHDEVLGNLSSMKLLIASRKGQSFEEKEKIVLELMDTIITDLRFIQSEVYPVIVKHFGFRKCLAVISKDLEKRYCVTIEHNDNIPFDKEIEIPVVSKINIMRIFKAVLLNFICEEGGSELSCTLDEKKGKLRMQIIVITKNSIPRPFEEFFLVEKNDSVIARILSLHAEISEKTDWVSHVEISLPVTFEVR